MRRQILTQADDDDKSVAIQITRDEALKVVIADHDDTAFILTIAKTPEAAPMIEMHGTGAGIDITPASVRDLIEGDIYQYNIWELQADGYVRWFYGNLAIGKSIAPTGAETPAPDGDDFVAIVASRAEFEGLQDDVATQADAVAALKEAGVKAFSARQNAVDFGQSNLPENLGRIFTIEGESIKVRGPYASDDALFGAAPKWGVSLTLPSITAVVNLLADERVAQQLKIDELRAAGVKAFGSRQQAVEYEQKNLPEDLGRIFTVEGGQLVMRGAYAETDPLFNTMPKWGISLTMPSSQTLDTEVAALRSAGLKAFGSKQSAVDYGQGSLNADLGRVFTVENGDLVMRGPFASAEALFANSPQWGVSLKIPSTTTLASRVENDVKAFGSRSAAVSFTQTRLPASVGRLFTAEADELVMRGPYSSVDALFATSPQWGVSFRLATTDAAVRVAREQIANERTTWTIDNLAFFDGFIRSSNGVVESNANYAHAFGDCAAGETMRFSADLFGSAIGLVVWFGPDRTYLSSYGAGSNTAPVQYRDIVLTVPEGAVEYGVTYRRADVFAPVAETSDVLPDMPALINRQLSAIGAGGAWVGKSMVALGTSIPAGETTQIKYPEQVAAALGAIMHNEAIAGSCVRNGVASRRTAEDPFGWAETTWGIITRSLSMTIAEKQDIIDNWATYRTRFRPSSNPPTTLSNADKTRILSSSWENVLAPYFDDPPDLWIFDHGFNDAGSGDDLVDGDDDTRDRGTFIGAMNYLIDKIRERHPRAKIAFIGHYNDDDPVRTTLAAGQKRVADLYGLPICPLYDRLGWSKERAVTTTGYWQMTGNTGVWQDSGGPEQTLTMNEVWCPDGIHPDRASDGKSIARIAEVLIPWFNDLR